MWIRGSLLGMVVLDLQGAPVGRVQDTYPADGSCPEFAVVRLGRFGERVLVALDLVKDVEGALQLPYTRAEIEDAPSPESARYEDDRVSLARAYWAMQDGRRDWGFARTQL
jgi:hypothetical protein